MRALWLNALFAIVVAASSVRGQTGTIAGVVPSGATVSVDGTGRVVTADSSGHFTFANVPAGTHRLVWHHPALDSLGLAMQSVSFAVPANDTVTVSLVKPSPRALFAVFCGNAAPGVLVAGRVSLIGSDQPVAGATVTATWSESSPVGRSTTTDTVGRYHVCVSPAHAISIHASSGADAHTYLPASPMESVQFADLRLGAAADHASATISGRVVADSGRPVPDAAIRLLGVGATATTSHDGQFLLSGLPTGTQVIVARSVGMDPFLKAVDLSTGAPSVLTVVMRRTPPTLATVNVTASKAELAATYDRIGFTERKKIGLGRFLTQDQIRKTAGHTVADALNGYTGIYAGDNGDHGINGDVVDGQNDNPHPELYRPCTLYVVDGQVLGEGEDDFGAGLPPPDQVIAIEVYRVGEPKPVKVSFGADVCAEVLVWTKSELRQK